MRLIHARRTSFCLFIVAGGAVLASLTPSADAAPSLGPNATPPTITETSCGNGISAEIIRPAPNFDPLTATDEQLDLNGFETRPADPSRLSAWKRYATHPVAHLSSCAALKALPEYAGTSPNWGGNEATSHNYDVAHGDWGVPLAESDAAHYTAKSVTWVGIGQGTSTSDPLIQAGSGSYYGNGLETYFIWWEVYPQLSIQTVYSNVTWNDYIGVTVKATSSTAYMHIVDVTKSFDETYTYSLSNWNSDDTAEWIVERPDFAAGYPWLAKTTNVVFADAKAQYGSSGYVALGSLSHTYFNMVTCDRSTIMSFPGAISSNGLSFTEYWQAYGDNDACG